MNFFRPVLPTVEPGFMQEFIPKDPPIQGEHWKDILHDVETKILQGVTHWSSPDFYAYYPAANSYPAVIGEMICSGLGNIGFNWVRKII